VIELLGAFVIFGAALYCQQRVFNAERGDWAKERAGLIQRIQAPEIAVRQHAERPRGERVMAVPVDDDKAYAEARKRREGLNGNGD
jgi:hypothetical protein